MPVWSKSRIHCLSVLLGYRMWQKKESKLELAASMVRQGRRKVLAYVTSPEKDSGNRRLFFSTVFPEQLQIFCAWQEKSPLNQTGSSWMQYIPLFLYSFRWSVEVSYYEQKTFWSLCSYMVRSRKGIEMLVNLINISYCAMKLLPYQDEAFYKYQTESVQEGESGMARRMHTLCRVSIPIIMFATP